MELTLENLNLHRPPHIFSDEEIYFVSCRTVGKVDYFLGDRKIILKNFLIKAIDKYKISIYAWAILNNHYHLLFSFTDKDIGVRSDKLKAPARLIITKNFAEPEICRAGCAVKDIQSSSVGDKFRSAQFVSPKKKVMAHSQLSRFIQYIHRDSVRLVNQVDRTPGRKVWYQYWDTVIDNEKDFYACFNYIHSNPIKHGLVADLQELAAYPFCSYHDWHN